MSFICIYDNEIGHRDHLIYNANFRVIVFESETEAYMVAVNLISGNKISIEEAVKSNFISQSSMTDEILNKTAVHIENELERRSYICKEPLWKMGIIELSKSQDYELFDGEEDYAVSIGDHMYSIGQVNECVKFSNHDLLFCCISCDSVIEQEEAYEIDESSELICESCLSDERYAVRCEFERHQGNKVVRIEDAKRNEFDRWICYHCIEMLGHH